MIHFPPHIRTTPCMFRTRSYWDTYLQRRVTTNDYAHPLKLVREIDTGKLIMISPHLWKLPTSRQLYMEEVNA